MPGTNGIEFLKFARHQHPVIPFILFTGRGRKEVAIEAINNGRSSISRKEGIRSRSSPIRPEDPGCCGQVPGHQRIAKADVGHGWARQGAGLPVELAEVISAQAYGGLAWLGTKMSTGMVRGD